MRSSSSTASPAGTRTTVPCTICTAPAGGPRPTRARTGIPRLHPRTRLIGHPPHRGDLAALALRHLNLPGGGRRVEETDPLALAHGAGASKPFA